MLKLYVYFQKTHGLLHSLPANSGVSINNEYNTGEQAFPNWQERQNWSLLNGVIKMFVDISIADTTVSLITKGCCISAVMFTDDDFSANSHIRDVRDSVNKITRV